MYETVCGMESRIEVSPTSAKRLSGRQSSVVATSLCRRPSCRAAFQNTSSQRLQHHRTNTNRTILLHHHSLNGSSEFGHITVLTATFNSYGDMQISTPPPHKLNTPEPIDKKIGTVDYVREGTPYTKFGTNSPTGGFWANG